jgi:hypothetical protein
MLTQVVVAAGADRRQNRSASHEASFDPGRPIWVVRVDRPDGTHNFVGPEPGESAAETRRAHEQAQWAAAGMWAPAMSTVRMAAAAFVEHARRHPNCTSELCPRSTQPKRDAAHFPGVDVGHETGAETPNTS